MVREDPRHLLVVPIYRLIYEPLRAYVLVGSLVQALRGRAVGWYKPERTNTVSAPATASETPLEGEESTREPHVAAH